MARSFLPILFIGLPFLSLFVLLPFSPLPRLVLIECTPQKGDFIKTSWGGKGLAESSSSPFLFFFFEDAFERKGRGRRDCVFPKGTDGSESGLNRTLLMKRVFRLEI